MRKLLIDLVWHHLCKLDVISLEGHNSNSLYKNGNILPVYERWLQEWFRIFKSVGYLKQENNKVIVVSQPEKNMDELLIQWDQEKDVWLNNHHLRAQVVLLDKIIHKLPSVLIGDKLSTEILFPNSSLELVEAVYKNNPMADHFNQVLTDKVMEYINSRQKVKNSPKIRILEIGAGTGATTALLLKKLANHHDLIQEYCYTDVSNAFLNHAEKLYGPENPFLTYKILNIEEPINRDKFTVSGFDIVIAANVLHATTNISETLRHTKSLLMKNGLLFLNEIAINSLFSHMTFGLLEGWWLYNDPEIRIPGCPGLYSEAWKNALESEGFRSVTFPCANEQGVEQQIIIAESDGFYRLPQVNQITASAINTPDIDNVVNTDRDQQVGADKIEAVLVEELSTSLRIDKEKINVDEPLSSYGLDSILAVNFTRSINEKLEIDMDITVMFEYATIGQLSDYIVLNFQDNLTDLLTSEDTPTEATPISETELVDADTAPISSLMNTETGEGDKDFSDPINNKDDIAIIGIYGRFPGADNLNDFWTLIEKGESTITRIPQQRQDWQLYTNDALSEIFNLNDKWGGFLDNIHDFDPLFFDIAPAEAVQMTPEQRLILMSVWNAIEDGGYTPKILSQHPTGVFIAVGPSDYHSINLSTDSIDNAGLLSSPSASAVPNRVSYHFNFQGPSEFCDTTCSSSIVALHRALQSIRQGECKQAIVGGVNLIASPMGFLNMEAVGMLSHNDKVHPFQDTADGTVRSEGVGAMLVKPLHQALADNDSIYAVVKGSGVAHGGKGVSLTAPNIQGMKSAITQAYNSTAIDPNSISYIEAHGMSSTLADSAEITALKSSFTSTGDHAAYDTDRKTYISSLKPCIGHAETVSGMAAIFKVIFAMKHKKIPSIPGFEKLNSSISLDDSPLTIANENITWNEVRDEHGELIPRRASINSFGVGGINAYMILEESPKAEYSLSTNPNNESLVNISEHIIVLSARAKEQLIQRAYDLFQFIQSDIALDLESIAYTLQLGRKHMEYRLAFIVTSIEHLISQLQDIIDSDEIESALNYSEPEGRYQKTGSSFQESEEKLTIEKHIKEKNLSEMLRCWLQGKEINWSMLYVGRSVKKVAMPTYPFKKINCYHDFDTTQNTVKKSKHEHFVNQQSSSAIKDTDSILDIIISDLGISEEEINKHVPLQDYGLNSLLLTSILAKIHKINKLFDPSWLQAQYSLEDIRSSLSTMHYQKSHESNHISDSNYPELLHLNTVSEGQPVFWIHGALGSVETFQSVAKDSEHPFYAIQARGFMTDDSPIEGINKMAAYYIEIIQTIQPSGPYDIGGFCLGGIIAYEMTRQLQLQGQEVKTLVMVDSPDNTAFKNAAESTNIPLKNAALQVINMLLWAPNVIEHSKISENMIHQDELDISLDEDQFINQLADLAKKHGLLMSHSNIISFIRQNVAVQISYQLSEYVIQPLSDTDGVNCYYFRNKGGLFFGDLAPYLQLPGDSFSLDHVNYWQDWQRELSNFNMIDVDADNHMTIMFDQKSISKIIYSCQKLYSNQALMPCI